MIEKSVTETSCVAQDKAYEKRYALQDIDPGTELLNKRAITDYAKRLIDESALSYNVTIAVIDLDDFKSINDTFGHSFGDEVLEKAAQIIKDAVGTHGAAGRIGGDELFIVLKGMENEEQIRSVLKTIRSNIEWAYNGSEDIITTCSIGCATYPSDAKSFDELFKIADKLLYLAKEKGKNRYIIYEDDVHRNYINETGKAGVRTKDILKYNKRSTVLEIMDDYVFDNKMTLEEICEKIGPCFKLEDISIYKAPEWSRNAVWGIFKDCELDIPYVQNGDYMRNFDRYNMFVIDSLPNIRPLSEQLYQVLLGQKISASVHYLIGTKENPLGLITFNKSKLARKWAISDLDWLCMLSHMIELKEFGKRSN